MRLLKVRQSTKKVEGGIMFPTTHDLHIEHVDWWGPFLREMLENGNEVLIVTKPEYAAIEWICKNLKEFSDQIEFRFTIGTNDDKVAAYWEPGAPSPSDRFQALAATPAACIAVALDAPAVQADEPEHITRPPNE